MQRDLLKPEVVMARLGYKSRKPFLAMCRKKGLRYVQINARVIRFIPEVVDGHTSNSTFT